MKTTVLIFTCLIMSTRSSTHKIFTLSNSKPTQDYSTNLSTDANKNQFEIQFLEDINLKN